MVVLFVISIVALALSLAALAIIVFNYRDIQNQLSGLQNQINNLPMTTAHAPPVRTVERERVVIDRADPGRGSQLWYVLRIISRTGEVSMWTTTNSKDVTSYKKPKGGRIFMTTTVAYSGEDARKKAEDSRTWKELG